MKEPEEFLNRGKGNFINCTDYDDAIEAMKKYATQNKCDKLKAVEVCEIGQIKVNGIIGENLIDAAKECIYLVNLLNIAVQLYWNGNYINVYKGTTIEQIIEKSLS